MQFINFYYGKLKRRIYLNPQFIRRIDDEGVAIHIYAVVASGSDSTYSLTDEANIHDVREQLKVLQQVMPEIEPKPTAIADPYPEYPVGTKVTVNGRKYQTVDYRIIQTTDGVPRIVYNLADCEDTDKTIQLSEQQVTWYGRGNGSKQIVSNPAPRYKAGDRLWFLGDDWVIKEVIPVRELTLYQIENPTNAGRMTISEKEIKPWMVNQSPEQMQQRTSEDYKFDLTVDELGY